MGMKPALEPSMYKSIWNILLDNMLVWQRRQFWLKFDAWLTGLKG